MLDVSLAIKETGKSAKTYDLKTTFPPSQTLEEFNNFLKATLIQTSIDVLDDAQKRGFDKEPRVRVDNNFNKPVRNVKPFGKIEFFAKLDAVESIQNIYNEIMKRSIEVTGTYARHNLVFYNNVLVASTTGELARFLQFKAKEGFGPRDTVRFINTTPYARKLESYGYSRSSRGKNAGQTQKRKRRPKNKKGKTLTRPNGAYYLSFRVARRKYKSIAGRIKFTYLPGGSVDNGAKPFGVQPNGSPWRTTFSSRFGGGGRPYLYPSIILDLSPSGISNQVQGVVQ